MKLANAWMDATFAKEYIASKIYKKYLPTVEVNLTRLHVQGNYLGMYVNTESINKQFLKKKDYYFKNYIGSPTSFIKLENLSNYQPRKYIIDNYGPINAGRALKKFIFENFKDRVLNEKKKVVKESDVDYICIRSPLVGFKV